MTNLQPSKPELPRSAASAAARQAKSATPWAQFVGSRWAILGVLFLVTGFLGLPFLWSSPAFTRREKWLWTIINVLYTSTLISITASIVWWAWSNLRELLVG